MRVLVTCDEQGEIQSIAIPNPELGGSIGFEVDTEQTTHELDVTGVIDEDDLLKVVDEETRRATFDKLSAMIKRQQLSK